MAPRLARKPGTWVPSWKPPLPAPGEPTSQSPLDPAPSSLMCSEALGFLHFLPGLGWWPLALSPVTDHAGLQTSLHDAGSGDLYKPHAWPRHFLPQLPSWLPLPSGESSDPWRGQARDSLCRLVLLLQGLSLPALPGAPLACPRPTVLELLPLGPASGRPALWAGAPGAVLVSPEGRGQGWARTGPAHSLRSRSWNEGIMSHF